MADTTLLFRTIPAKIDTLELDCSVSETHTRANEVTDHPVEKGANVSDHARSKPDMLTLEGIVSNTPLNKQQQQRIVESRGVNITSTSASDAPAGAVGYAEQGYAKLSELMDKKTLITVVTALRTYENMILETLTVPRDARTGDALRFTGTFKQIRLVDVQKTTVTVATKTPRANKKQKLGTQYGPPAPTGFREKTVLKSTTDVVVPALRKFFGI